MLAPVTSEPANAPTQGMSDQGPTLIEVTWVDIISDSSWTPPEDVNCPIFISVGYFVSQDAKTLKIADTVDEEGSFFGVTAFPLGVVLKQEKAPTSGA